MTQQATSRPDVQRAFESQTDALARGDIDAVLEHVTDDIVLTDMTTPNSPVRGKDAMREWLQAFFASFTIVRSEIKSFIAQDDRLAAEVEVAATYTGDDFGVEAKGRQVVLRYGVFDTLEDGRVRTENAYSDAGELTRQLTDASATN